MKIIRFYAKWCHKCKIFSDKEKLNYDIDIDIDSPLNKTTLIKYQISVVPTFLALTENNRIRGKLVNPVCVDDYLKWKERFKK